MTAPAIQYAVSDSSTIVTTLSLQTRRLTLLKSSTTDVWEVDGDRIWNELLALPSRALRALADEARRESLAGETEELDPEQF